MAKKKVKRFNSARIKKKFLKALYDTKGIVTAAAESTGVPRKHHYDWYHSDPDYKKEVDSIQDVAVDFVESKLMNRIDSGSDASIIFYMKCKGKKRGYIERQELDVTGEMKNTTNILDLKLDKATKQKIIKAMEEAQNATDG